MVDVAFCLAQQDFPGEQAFSPQGNEADGVQIGRVQGPESHDFLDSERPHNVDFPCAAGKRLQRGMPNLGCSATERPFQSKRFFKNILVAGIGTGK